MKLDAEKAERNGDFGTVAEIRYGKLKQLAEKIEEEKTSSYHQFKTKVK